ncbi:hypothetical protein [Reichenbachiella sp.]|uniref:hypothetical protein n=1 Tax=Reichenbachiella sp. TaxID=2184521 RepID=UPI003296F353
MELFNQVIETELINNPTKSVFALNHNLLIHSPQKGQDLLALLNKPTDDNEVLSLLFLETLFAGQFGEELALNNLESSNNDWSESWARYLSKNAIYNSSISKINVAIQKSTNTEIQRNLLSSLMYIGSPKSIDFIKQIIDTTKNDLIQTQAIFVYAELTGFYGIKELEKVETVGKKSKSEKEGSLSWLKEETNSVNIYGTEVTNDFDFAMRFGDIKSPSMIWMEGKKLLTNKALKNPKPLSESDKNEILDILTDSKCFGLEAIKGTLFLSVTKDDMNKLIELRRLNYYSPNGYTQGRNKTLGILIRYLKKK